MQTEIEKLKSERATERSAVLNRFFQLQNVIGGLRHVVIVTSDFLKGDAPKEITKEVVVGRLSNALELPIPDFKDDRPRIVCLCGSTRFEAEYKQANYNETMQGKIVLSVGCFQGQFGWGNAKPGVLDELHKRKIDLADEILVLNVGGYIGESTKSEIDYAENFGKTVRYSEVGQPLEIAAAADFNSSRA